MDRHLLTMRVTVKDGERAILTRNGRFERVLEPGRHKLLDPKRELGVELHQIVRAGDIRPGAEPVSRCLARRKGLSADRPDRD